MIPHLLDAKILDRDYRLKEVNLEVALKVKIGYLLSILDTEDLAKLLIGDNAALEVRVKAIVGLHVGRDELRDSGLRRLRLGRKTHEYRKLVADGAKLEEGIVRTASLPNLALLGSHVLGVLAAALLGVASLALDRLCNLKRLTSRITNTGSKISGKRLKVVLKSREKGVGRTNLGSGRIGGNSRHGGNSGSNG